MYRCRGEEERKIKEKVRIGSAGKGLKNQVVRFQGDAQGGKGKGKDSRRDVEK